MSPNAQLLCLLRGFLSPILPAIGAIIILMLGPASSADEVGTQNGVKVGIEGHYRVGRWTAVRCDAPGGFTSIETRDGDGVQVQYDQTSTVAPGGFGYAIPGSQAAPIDFYRDGDVLVSARFPTLGSPSRGPSMIPLSMPWIVCLGDPLGVDEIGANELLQKDAKIAVSRPTAASGLPDSVLGYDGVDMLMLGRSSIDLLREMSEPQQKALSKWITDGGRAFVTLGKSAPELMEAAPWLRELLPLESLKITKLDPSAVETYTSSQTPLQEYSGVQLPKDKGRVLIMGRTVRRATIPIAARYNVGFGRITVVAADLDDEMFAEWPERLDLITQLTGRILVLSQEGPGRVVNRATAYGDLAGQMRLTLDQFSIKRNFGFSIVSLILMALIAAIGPLDFLLINRVLGKPLLGWVSFPLTAIGLSVLLALQSRPVPDGSALASTKDASLLRCNRLEFLDIDTVNDVGRNFVASYVYSHDATLMDIDVTETKSFSAVSNEIEQVITTPFGYPGESFGGIQIAVEDARLPVYRVSVSEDEGTQRHLIRGLPLASRSSKGIATVSRFSPRMSSEVQVEHRPGSELLQGELVNPLPFDLLEGMLVYRNWAYVLPTRFPAGGRVVSINSLRQKNFRWQLSRQKAIESATESEAWDPKSSDSPQRVMEMLMFHSAVGGSRYTSLAHKPLSFLDLSHVLADDRCMLIGKVAQPLTQLEVRTGESKTEPEGSTLSFVRVVLPVSDFQRP